MRDYVVNVDVRFQVKACSDSEAWKICEAKAEQVERLLKDVADDFVAADVWDYTEDVTATEPTETRTEYCVRMGHDM